MPQYALRELRAIYARPGVRDDVQRVAGLLGALYREGDAERASEGLAAFRARRGWCFRDAVRDLLDDLWTPRRASIANARRWAERALEGLQRAG